MTNAVEPYGYKHPPIVEAIIGITFTDRIHVDHLASLQQKFSAIYPTCQIVENVNLKVAVDVSSDNKKTANTDLVEERGHRFASSDMTELLTIFARSFFVSQLAPYPGWDIFFDRFSRDWKYLKRIVGYQSIERIGVRYINRIDIPTDGPTIDEDEYLRIVPKVPNQFGPMAAYAVQAEIYMADLDSKLLINTAVVPSPMLNTASFIIDQDIVRVHDVPQKDEDIFKLLSEVRTRKNDVFESCVTHRARELFNK